MINNNNKKNTMVGVRLSPQIREIVKKLAAAAGMNEAEFLRSLLYKELERLSILSTNFAKAKEEWLEEVK